MSDEIRLLECPVCQRHWRHLDGVRYIYGDVTYTPRPTQLGRSTCPVCRFFVGEPSSNDTNKNLVYRQRMGKRNTS